MEDDRRWPKDVGIRAMHVVIPSLYVDQADLERYDRVSEGKYTVGLGQKQMGFCTDLQEDVNSLCLTAVSQLVENNGLSYSDIGRLEVGTETLVDKSKSAKTVVMQLFAAAGNHRVEGVDTTNACYGGTAALFNALAWAESSAWDGRLAVVVAADIAVYAAGSSARATGGAGAVAMLVGPGASLVVDRGLRGTYMDHAYDFYKPDLGSEYPVVDGQLSVRCYLNALDRCYESYRGECGARGHAVRGLDAFDSFVFHAPYCKLVRKALARLYAKDSVREKTSADDKAAAADKTSADEKAAAVDKTSAADKTSADDKAAEAAAMDRSRPVFEAKTEPSLMLASRVGNTYTASVYSGLASYLLSVPPERLAGKRIGVFSYGSGLASSMYSITVVDNGLAAMVGRLRESVSAGLRRRTRFTAEQFADALDVRRESLHRAPYAPAGDRALLFPGTWYLSGIDEMRRRHYERKE